MRPLWRSAFRAHVAAVMLTGLIGVCSLAAARVSCALLLAAAISSAALSLWLRLVRCNVVRRALSAACRVSHVVPMHQCIPFHSACLLHVLRDCCCCSVSAARFLLPVAVLHGACGTSPAARRLCLRVSHVLACSRMRRFANLRMIARPRPMRCPVCCRLQLGSPRCPLSAARCQLARNARTQCRYGAGGGGGQEDAGGPSCAAHSLAHACHCHRLRLH